MICPSACKELLFIRTYVKPSPQNILIFRSQKSGYVVAVPSHRGALAIVIDAGRVVESGTPDELLANGALFAALFGEEVAVA